MEIHRIEETSSRISSGRRTNPREFGRINKSRVLEKKSEIE